MMIRSIESTEFPSIDCAMLLSRGLELVWATDEFNSLQERQRMLALVDREDEKKLPLVVDFLSDELSYRRRHGLAVKQPFARALGLKSVQSGEGPRVFDATSGLGTDAFLMAAMGCQVLSVERSPVLFALINDGFMRLKNFIEENRKPESEFDPEAIERLAVIVGRMSFVFGEATDYLRNMSETDRPDVIYLDPMYPPETHGKSALPKKTMQIFRRLIGEDQDAASVLELSLMQARTRVVVKRPLHAEPLAQRKPTHEFEGKTARYDMYLAQQE